MEIEVGEYGRTNKGKIFIFAWLENSDGKRYTNKVLLGNGKIFENKFYYFDDGEEIVKHSKNIIDLIELGDYVNGEQVSNVDKIDNINFIEWTDGDMYKTEIENDKFIETIVTKEMMESISYKVTKM